MGFTDRERSRVSHWSGEKQRRWRDTTRRAGAIVLLRIVCDLISKKLADETHVLTTTSNVAFRLQSKNVLTCAIVRKLSQRLSVAIPISFPEPANFLRRMLDENDDSGKDQFLGGKALYNVCQNHVSQIALSSYDHELDPINMAIKLLR